MHEELQLCTVWYQLQALRICLHAECWDYDLSVLHFTN